jgi:putative tryptophan/tyrosine transport system substrate-binding protein
MRKIAVFLTVISLVLFTVIGCDNDNDDGNPIVKLGPSVVLLTDYSAGSDIVARMTGTVLHTYPNASFEYIPSKTFNIREAGYILDSISDIYPVGTIFVVIVEPSTNPVRIVFESSDNAVFLIPDNGLGTRVFRSTEVGTVYSVTNSSLFSGSDPGDLSTEEFYTTALMEILKGTSLSDFGSENSDPVVHEIQEPEKIGETVFGEVLFTDNFGNCITNIPDSLLTQINHSDLLRVSANSESFLIKMGEDYSSVSLNQNVAIINNSDRLQLSVNYNNMAARYNLQAGSVISVTPGIARVGILQFSSVTASFAEAAIAQLATFGLIENETVEFISRNSDGDISLLADLASSFNNEEIDVLLTFATPPSQAAAMDLSEDIPIVFSAVTDPESAGLFVHRGNITGLSDKVDNIQFIEFAQRLFPDIDNAGIIYNDQESNSNYVVEQLTSIGNLYGISLITTIANSVNEIPTAYQQFAPLDIDVFLTSGDNIISGGMSSLVTLASADSLGVIGSDVKNAENGALATISIDYDLLASHTGNVIVDILLGLSAQDIEVVTFETDVIALNEETADQIGYEFSQTLRNDARFIYPE